MSIARAVSLISVIIAITASGYSKASYRASFILSTIEPLKGESVVWNPPSTTLLSRLAQSDDFWTKYISEYLAKDSRPTTEIRTSFTAKLAQADHGFGLISQRYEIEIEEGAEKEFDAFVSGLRKFFTRMSSEVREENIKQLKSALDTASTPERKALIQERIAQTQVSQAGQSIIHMIQKPTR